MPGTFVECHIIKALPSDCRAAFTCSHVISLTMCFSTAPAGPARSTNGSVIKSRFMGDVLVDRSAVLGYRRFTARWRLALSRRPQEEFSGTPAPFYRRPYAGLMTEAEARQAC